MPDFQHVRINEIATDANGSAHLLKFDSIHGTWEVNTDSEKNTLIVGGQTLSYSSNPAIADTDWLECDIFIE